MYYAKKVKDKLKILNENGELVEQYNNVHGIEIGKSFIEINTYTWWQKNVSGISYSYLKKRIISRKNLRTLFYEKIENIPTEYSREFFSTDYVYLNPLTNCLINEDGDVIQYYVESFTISPMNNNTLLVKRSNNTYSLIHDGHIVIWDADYMDFVSDKLLVVKGNQITLYQNYAADTTKGIQVVSTSEISSAVNIAITALGNYAICIRYYSNVSKIPEKVEIRSLLNLSKKVVLESNEYLSKDLSDNDEYNRNNLGYLLAYEKLRNTKFYSLEKRYIKIKKYCNSNLVVYKFLYLDGLTFLTDGYVTGSKILTDANSDQYLVLKRNDGISSFLLPHCTPVLSGNFTDIKLSDDMKYFILERGKNLGVASLYGEILIECKQNVLIEDAGEFLYSSAELSKFEKTM